MARKTTDIAALILYLTQDGGRGVLASQSGKLTWKEAADLVAKKIGGYCSVHSLKDACERVGIEFTSAYPSNSNGRVSTAALEQRIAILEQQVGRLQMKWEELNG